jgi:hypothetical protein
VEELAELINLNLFELGENPNNIEDNVMKYLLKIENIISTTFKSYEDTLAKLKSHKLYLSKISKDADISRQTIYNNPLIRTYCNYRIEKFISVSIDFQAEKKSQRLLELEETIEKMKLRDVNEELLKYKNKLLEEELRACKKENIELHKKYFNATHVQLVPNKENANGEVIKFPET